MNTPGSWKDLTITGTSAAPSLETTWELEDAAWSDRDYPWTNLGGFTPGNYKYMAKTGVTARTQSFTITVPTTMIFGVKIVVLSDGASPPLLTTANGWDLTCAGIDKIEGTGNYMTHSVGNLTCHPCHARVTLIALHEWHLCLLLPHTTFIFIIDRRLHLVRKQIGGATRHKSLHTAYRDHRWFWR